MTALPRSLPSLVHGGESRDVSSPGSEKAERPAACIASSCGSRRSWKSSSAVGSVRASRPSQLKSVARCFRLLRVFLTGLTADMIKDALRIYNDYGEQRKLHERQRTRGDETRDLSK